MKIIRAGYAGFCNGVRRAIELAEKALREEPAPVYTIGEIIHNPGVVESLARRGLRVAETAGDVPAGCAAVIRAHGLPAEEIATLRARNVNIIDGTCPNVARAAAAIKEAAIDGRLIYIAGDTGHPEMKAHASIAPGSTIAISGIGQLGETPVPDVPSALLAQTTFAPESFEAMKEYLKSKISELNIIDTVCGWTRKAQRAAADAAEEAELMIIVGGRNSANTARLAETARAAGAETILIESVDELRDRDFSTVKTAGVTGGASTPPEDIDAVTDFLENMC